MNTLEYIQRRLTFHYEAPQSVYEFLSHLLIQLQLASPQQSDQLHLERQIFS